MILKRQKNLQPIAAVCDLVCVASIMSRPARLPGEIYILPPQVHNDGYSGVAVHRLVRVQPSTPMPGVNAHDQRSVASASWWYKED